MKLCSALSKVASDLTKHPHICIDRIICPGTKQQQTLDWCTHTSNISVQLCCKVSTSCSLQLLY